MRQIRTVLRSGGERPLLHGITYAEVLYQLDKPRSNTRPRGVLRQWREGIDKATPTHRVMTSYIVKTSSESLGWKHKQASRRALNWTLTRRTRYLVRWAERIGYPVEPLLEAERTKARQTQGELEVLNIALRMLKRASASAAYTRKRSDRVLTKEYMRKYRAQRYNTEVPALTLRQRRAQLTARAIIDLD